MIQRNSILTTFIANTDFLVTSVQIWSSLQTDVLLSMTLLFFPVSTLLPLIIGVIF